MEIQQLLLKFKFHILITSTFSILIFALIYLAPRFLDILKYFWPLLLSTALFLVAIVLFGRISSPVTEVSGEGILDYVAGQSEELQPHLHELHEGEGESSKVE
ncbi:hypothetical protein RND71_037731 [Anisodus tanguticus]|uniref:Uncharacterized protein n=1 Tax=Anisodus tanguticus TaxID=243964 RepID=A0AAE1QYC2_9SOLA|nr:hypothetical protein RND71_037731 [Anisodus tanguticus]